MVLKLEELGEYKHKATIFLVGGKVIDGGLFGDPSRVLEWFHLIAEANRQIDELEGIEYYGR